MAIVALLLKTLFIMLMCIMVATLAYFFAMDGGSSCFKPSVWWGRVVLVDLFVLMTPIVAWYFYKETSWIKRVIFIFATTSCGSIVTCGYIAMQFFTLSPEESSKDHLYFVLATCHNTDVMEHVKRSSIVTAKVIVTSIGCFMLGIIIFAYIIDGSPFYVEILTLCTITALIDVCNHVMVFSVWIAYKESSWISIVLWILLLVCFSGISICIYIMRELFNLSHGQPLSFILFNKNNRDMTSGHPLLIEDSDV